MKPTYKLRYVRRVTESLDILAGCGKSTLVLQQWWQADDQDWDKGLVSEWRDIEIEEEK